MKEMTLIQQNIARPKAVPRTVADLESELERLDYVLLEAKRGRNAARARVPDLMANGDAQGIEDGRKEIAGLDAQIADFTERRKQTEEAIRAAQSRDRVAYAAQDYRDIRKQVAAFKTSVFRLADSVEVFGKALMQARAQQDAMEAAMRGAGIEPDPYVIRSKLMGLIEMSLYLATEGALGKIHSLYSSHELRQSGNASLTRAANEAHEFFLRQVRNKLGISAEPPEAA
jgi:cell division septum initiation protein DivIVA